MADWRDDQRGTVTVVKHGRLRVAAGVPLVALLGWLIMGTPFPFLVGFGVVVGGISGITGLTRRLNRANAVTLGRAPELEDRGADAVRWTGPTVAELAHLGYERACTDVLGGGVERTLLTHPDGSVANVNASATELQVAVYSCFLPGRTWLRTAVAFDSHIGPHLVVDPCAKGSSPTEVVERHRATRGLFADHGVAVYPVTSAGVTTDEVTRRRAAVDDANGLNPTSGASRRTCALRNHPDLAAAVVALRAGQAELAALR